MTHQEGSHDPLDLRKALGSFSTGVVLITTRGPDGERVGLTVNSFASVSLRPPLVLWSLLVHSPNMAAFQAASHFAVNVLGRSHKALARQFGRSNAQKFSGDDLWLEGAGGAPLLATAVAQFECRNAQRYYGGDHVIFLGEVEAYRHGPGEPLLFNGGRFGDFVPHLDDQTP